MRPDNRLPAKKKKRLLPRSMTFAIPAFIFVVMFLSMTLFGFVTFILISHRYGVPRMHGPDFFQPVPMVLFVSIIVGTTVTALLSRIPLQPVQELIQAINRLADGDFNVRIQLNETEEFEKLSKSFNRMAEELGNTEMLRTDFVNNFSHEFKTPIVSMQGFAKLLKKENLTVDERNEYLDIIIQESARLAQLSTNILNLSAIEKMCILPEAADYNLTEQIRRCLLMAENRWSKKNLNLDIDLDEIIFHGNEELISQIWINLLDNAIKFSDENQPLRLSLKEQVSVSHSRLIQFQISNTGTAMTEETRTHLFDKFYQGDTSHKTEGNGIGLAIVKQIVDLYHGTISVEHSEPGVTKFMVKLPAGN